MNTRRTDSGRRPSTRERVAQNLSSVLNARPEYDGVTVFGLSDSAMLGPSKSQSQNLADAMLAAITRYEPRLASPQVVTLGRRDSIWIDYEARGRVDGESAAFLLRYSVIFRNVVVIDRASKERE